MNIWRRVAGMKTSVVALLLMAPAAQSVSLPRSHTQIASQGNSRALVCKTVAKQFGRGVFDLILLVVVE